MMSLELESGARLGSGLSRESSGKVAKQPLVLEWQPGRKGLRVVGEVDLVTRDAWDEVLTALLGNDSPARLDLSGLSFIDVQGVTALMDTARRMTPTRPMVLYRPPLSLRRTLDLFWSSELSAIVIEEEEAG